MRSYANTYSIHLTIQLVIYMQLLSITIVQTINYNKCTRIQGCQLAGATGYNIGKFSQAEFSVDSDSNAVITYNGGDDGR